MEQREYFRVKGFFSLSYRFITEEEHDRLGECIRVEPEAPENPSFHYLPASEQEPAVAGLEQLLPLFQEILFKLDLVLDHISSGEEGWEGSQGRLIDISGSGLQFTCPDAPPVPSLLEMKFQLPGHWGRNIHCAGRVIRVERLENCGWAVACEFTHICESDRERIIQYAFQVSCKMLREKRRREERLG